MEIKSKAEFFRLWEAGCLGNRPLLFHTLQEALDSGCEFIGFRELNKAGGGGAWEKAQNTPLGFKIIDTFQRWTALGRHFIMDGGCPNHLGTLQGEVCRTYRGWEGLIGLSNGLPMRPAMAAGLLVPRSGVVVKALLDSYMDPSSRDDLDAILDLYPDATVEFTCFSVDVGVIPNRNTIFWEVRNY